jgi:hypothetical protein
VVRASPLVRQPESLIPAGRIALISHLDPSPRKRSAVRTEVHRYWGRSWYVWNNTGDAAWLPDALGTLRDTCWWTSAGTGFKHC